MLKRVFCLIVALGFSVGAATDWHHVGVDIQTWNQIRYEFNETQGFSPSNFTFTFMRVGFVTNKKQGILMQIRDANNAYISLSINNNGGVKLQIDVGFQRWELNTNMHQVDLTDGRLHEVTMRREVSSGKDVHLKVDNYPETIGNMFHFGSVISDTILDRPRFVYLGNNDTVQAYTGNGFEGCIYGVQLDNIYLLQLALQTPPPPYVTTTPPTALQSSVCRPHVWPWGPNVG